VNAGQDTCDSASRVEFSKAVSHSTESNAELQRQQSTLDVISSDRRASTTQCVWQYARALVWAKWQTLL